MSFKRDSLAVLLDRIYANYISLFRPFDKTPRQNLLRVFASVDAGIYHQLLGDLDFLSKQIFPDTAEGEYLREHWSDKTPPLYAIAASGEASVTGIPSKTIPIGVVYQAASGENYYLEKSGKLDVTGKTIITLKAETPGIQGNLSAGEKLYIITSIPSGIDSEAVVHGAGITGGSDAESDEEYLARVLATLQNPSRYGKKGDYALWAKDASAEVSDAWDFWNFGVFGAVLVQVINGNQFNGIFPVGNLAEVRSYISGVAPPVLFDVRTPDIVSLNPHASLPPLENSQANRELAETRMKTWLQFAAKPGAQITAGALRLAAIDGVTISDITVTLAESTVGIVSTSILEYPYIGEIIWD